MSETVIWKAIEPIITKAFGDASRHEDKQRQGIPDISFGIDQVNGWIESKHLKAWPKGFSTQVKVSIKKKQRNWICKRSNTGGSCFLMLAVGTDPYDLLLIPGRHIMKIGHINKDHLIDLSCGYWSAGIDIDPGTFIGLISSKF